MPESKMDSIEIQSFTEFKNRYFSSSQTGKDLIWSCIKTPLIEKIPNSKDNNLVTFLYRKDKDKPTPSSIYLQCDIVGLPFSEESKFLHFPETDIWYLTLLLPSTLRTSYNFLIVDTADEIVQIDDTNHRYPLPDFSRALKTMQTRLSKLYELDKVQTDPNNPLKMTYADFKDPNIIFGKESILELPLAPKNHYIPISESAIKNEREKLANSKRFNEFTLDFSTTSLKDYEGYKKNLESKSSSAHETRKYWVYLPPDFKSGTNQTYPLILFLDGSEYLSTIPAPSILENMINEKCIPSCIAVFFEYSMDRRELEYYCDDKFTDFLVSDFIKILKTTHNLPISENPQLNSIVGCSASGLAAFYAALTYPDIFGNVITQSAALWSVKKADLEAMVDKSLTKNKDMFFCMQAGSYENIRADCQFSDGTTQAFSILEINQNISLYMKNKGIKVKFKEFVGGHNCICYKFVLPVQLQTVYGNR